jgi:YHS domain-containing protein
MAIVKDPVCGAEIDTGGLDPEGETSSGAARVDPTHGTKHLHEGTWFYFDSLSCRMKFMAAPDKYLQG